MFSSIPEQLDRVEVFRFATVPGSLCVCWSDGAPRSQWEGTQGQKLEGSQGYDGKGN